MASAGDSGVYGDGDVGRSQEPVLCDETDGADCLKGKSSYAVKLILGSVLDVPAWKEMVEKP